MSLQKVLRWWMIWFLCLMMQDMQFRISLFVLKKWNFTMICFDKFMIFYFYTNLKHRYLLQGPYHSIWAFSYRLFWNDLFLSHKIICSAGDFQITLFWKVRENDLVLFHIIIFQETSTLNIAFLIFWFSEVLELIQISIYQIHSIIYSI